MIAWYLFVFMFVWINRWDLIHIRNTCATCVLNIWYILTFYVRNNVILSLIYYIILHQLNYICWFLLKLQYNARKKWDDTIMIHKACHVYFLFASHSQKRRSRPLFSLPIWNYHLTWSMLIFGWAHLIVAHCIWSTIPNTFLTPWTHWKHGIGNFPSTCPPKSFFYYKPFVAVDLLLN